MATAEPEVPVTRQQQPPTKEKKPKAPKEKKQKVPKEKKAKQSKSAAHPPYFQMIKVVLLALNEKSGSSPYAIAKYMEEKHNALLPANFRKILALQLKNSAAKGKLIKVKAYYKLSAEVGKKGKANTAATKGKMEKKSTKVTTMKPRKAATTKKITKRGRAKKKSTPTKPKQPKSIKSPATKRAKKATA